MNTTITLAARKRKRQHYIDRAIEGARLAQRSLTCQEKPVEFHGTCAGLDMGAEGCLCECHDAELSS